MNVLSFREYCLSLPLTEETTPFDEDTLVYKVCGKMYAMGGISDFGAITVKTDPAEGLELRERYPEIEGAYHMNKRHWISMDTRGGLDDAFIKGRIEASYRLVASGLTRALKAELAQACEAEGFEL